MRDGIVAASGMPIDEVVVSVRGRGVVCMPGMERGERIRVSATANNEFALGRFGRSRVAGLDSLDGDNGRSRNRSRTGRGFANATGPSGGVGGAKRGMGSSGSSGFGGVKCDGISCGFKSVAVGHGMSVTADRTLVLADELASLILGEAFTP
jgi:hypothetical protein